MFLFPPTTQCASERALAEPLRRGLRGYQVSHGEKSGKLKFAFSWNLLGGARTQGFLGSQKEIPLHGSAYIDTRREPPADKVVKEGDEIVITSLGAVSVN
jgi:hypothetical protein